MTSRLRTAFMVALLIAGYACFDAFRDVVKNAANQVHSTKHLTEQQMWREIRQCEDELWECLRQPMARTDF